MTNPYDASSVEATTHVIADVVKLATAMLRISADQEGFRRLEAEITRRWPTIAPEHQDYAVGYALGFLAGQDSILERLGKPTSAEMRMERHGTRN
jgi:hypothetical protein